MNDEAGQVERFKEKIRAEGRDMTADRDRVLDHARRLGEPAFLVEFAIVRQIALGDDAQQLAVLHRQRTVEELARASERAPEEDQGPQALARFDDPRRRVLSGVQKRRLMMKVIDRISGQAQFREQAHGGMTLMGLSHQSDQRFGVRQRLGQMNLRREGGDAGEAVAVDIRECGHEVTCQRGGAPLCSG